MLFDEGSIGPVSFVPFAFSPPSFFNIVRKAASQFEVSSLPVASPPKVSSIPASGDSLATSSAVLPQSASPTDIVEPTLSRLSKRGTNSADVASAFRGLLQ